MQIIQDPIGDLATDPTAKFILDQKGLVASSTPMPDERASSYSRESLNTKLMQLDFLQSILG